MRLPTARASSCLLSTYLSDEGRSRDKRTVDYRQWKGRR
jgi:hypothetical protein